MKDFSIQQPVKMGLMKSSNIKMRGALTTICNTKH